MVASSVLPVAFKGDKLYFLFGKENEMEDSAKGFSDFGGRVEGKETLMLTALREGSEELCGFLGGPDQLKSRIKQGGGFYKISYVNETTAYHVHVFRMDYDENLPKYFTNNHRFLWKRMDKKMLNDSKLFEKQEIRWFSCEDVRRDRSLFRPFYRNIAETVLSHESNIRKFFSKPPSLSNKTMKRRGMKGG
jgi:predicted NUDIX family NTP pyrophosphohydrolase